jgi:hypothetical protein
MGIIMNHNTAEIKYISDNDRLELNLANNKEQTNIIKYLKDEELNTYTLFAYGFQFKNIRRRKQNITAEIIYHDTYDFDNHEDGLQKINNIIKEMPTNTETIINQYTNIKT